MTAELRWFWHSADASDAVATWFRGMAAHDCPAGVGRIHMDLYLVDAGNARIGIKRRDNGLALQIKQFGGFAAESCAADPFNGPIEYWVKGETGLAVQGATDLVEVSKRRWRRVFNTSQGVVEIPLRDDLHPLSGDLPEDGCWVEFTALDVGLAKRWTSLAFESFGAVESLGRGLQAVARELAQRRPPGLDGAIAASYPTWLQRPGFHLPL